MSDTKKPRVVRSQRPDRLFTENTYRRAIIPLLKDFEGRCAYSLQHVDRIGHTNMEVDHHDPRKKGKARHDYDNLFPASRHCNGLKGAKWPDRAARKSGLRFLNPCLEADYGEQIFEHPDSHELVGVTPSARYHILMLGLNASHLVAERRERANIHKLLNETPMSVCNTNGFLGAVGNLRESLKTMIPAILPPPPSIP